MANQLDLLPRADYENAEEQMMRPEVLKQPLLPLYEAIHNAIHASQERAVKDIVIEVDIHRDSANPISEIARIEGFTVTDYGIGFTDEKTEAFFKFAVSSSKCNTQSLGIGVF